MNTNLKVIGLTRLGIKPESAAQEADALTTRPSKLFFFKNASKLNQTFKIFCLCSKFELNLNKLVVEEKT